MRPITVSPCAFGLGTIVVIFCGCNGGGSPALGLPRSAQNVQDLPGSWMASDAKKQKLLYLGDEAADDVYVYSWPGLKLKGTLTGFNAPNGECADRAGDVFVANEDTLQILEYAHGGTSPIKTLSDSGEYPVGCSGGPGNVAIYPDASGTPTTYTDPPFYYYFFCGYDAHGVQWDGRHVAIGDQVQPHIYEFAISGISGTKVGSTPLYETNDVSPFWISGGRVVVPDFLNNEVQIFKYPVGGSAL